MSSIIALVFVYNADSGLFNTMSDIGHKIFSPQTYDCQLCALTYGYFTEREEWREFIDSLPMETVFLHRDEFQRQYPGNDAALPAVFLKTDETLKLCVDSDALSSSETIEELQDKIRAQCVGEK